MSGNLRQTQVLETCGTIQYRDWPIDAQPSLKWLQRAVGGSIELVVSRKYGVFGYANTNGLLDGLPVNQLAEDYLPPNRGEPYRGDIVLLFGFCLDDDTEMVTPDDLGSTQQP